MSIDEIRKALHRVPFDPFQLRLADGRSLLVKHPDFVALGPRRVVVVAPDNSLSVLEPFLIVSLDFNGHRASSRHRAK